MPTSAPSSIRRNTNMAVADLNNDGVDESLFAAAVAPVAQLCQAPSYHLREGRVILMDGTTGVIQAQSEAPGLG